MKYAATFFPLFSFEGLLLTLDAPFVLGEVITSRTMYGSSTGFTWVQVLGLTEKQSFPEMKTAINQAYIWFYLHNVGLKVILLQSFELTISKPATSNLELGGIGLMDWAKIFKVEGLQSGENRVYLSEMHL